MNGIFNSMYNYHEATVFFYLPQHYPFIITLVVKSILRYKKIKNKTTCQMPRGKDTDQGVCAALH